VTARTFGQRGIVARTEPIRRAPADIGSVSAPGENEVDVGERLLGAVPFTTIGLLIGLAAILVAAQHFAFDVGAGGAPSQDSLRAFGAVSYDLAIGAGQIWRIFLAPLLHASTSHLVGNCIALGLVGLRLEPLIGRGWFAAIFAASALGGVAGSLIGNERFVTTVGASGAITGIVAALLAMSFHHVADDGDQWRMRRRALVFGVPALLPLFLGVKNHVDYHAHLGGAVVGGAIGLLIALLWAGETFRPRFAALAGRLALAVLAASCAASLFIGAQYARRGVEMKNMIPESLLEGNPMEVADRAVDLVRQYPDDPRGPIFIAFSDLKLKHWAQAEAALRLAMKAEWPQRREAERPMHEFAQAILAAVLSGEGRRREALAVAGEFCAAGAPPADRAIVVKAKLCDGAN
jgi:rhomboid protease GluP